MENNIIKEFLTSFFALFKAYLIELKIEYNKVYGIVSWKGEEEKQSFYWEINFEKSILQKIRLLCEFLIKHDLILGDKISISLSELKAKLQKYGWDLNEAEKVIDQLCSVKIKMLDDGDETDSFFIHF